MMKATNSDALTAAERQALARFRCHVCGNETASSEFVDEVLHVDGRRVLVEHIPAQVCTRCGEAVFSHETTERVRQLVHGAGCPTKRIPLDVFQLA
ncbi:MAG: type II toxin-antitoxin system MqsA family antitoxin [Candidatus Binatia bacterium]|jgi:HTH-type transcriptional regulator / antitoxin MqsA